MKVFRVLAVFVVLSSLGVPKAAAGGGSELPQTESKENTIVVSILPQAYFVRRIAGDRFRPVVLVGKGQSPHSYEPTPRQMADLSTAAAWLRVGIDFEKGLAPKIAAAYPALPIFNVTEGAKFRQLEAHSHGSEEEAGEEQKAEEEQAEGGSDPHVWLGKQGARVIAGNIRDALSKLDPDGASLYAVNHDALVADIDSVFASLAPKLAPLRGKPIFVYHPAFGYFLDEFGIEQEAVETGGKEPTQKQLAALIAEAREDGAKVIFVQAQFPRSAAKTIADAIGGVVVPMDDLAPDWLDNLVRLGEAIEHAGR